MSQTRRLGAAFLLLLSFTGCESTPRTGTVAEARHHYDQGHFLASERAAADAMVAANDPAQREQAAYLAGLSAYQTGHFDDAERYLLVADDSADSILAARARAMRGLIELHRQRPREAADLLRQAASRLEAEEAERARSFARLADERAAAPNSLGSGPTPDLGGSEVRAPAPPPAAAAAYTLQLGAFRERDRAERLARDASSMARRHGLEPVRIIASTDGSGRALYLVQMGRFSTEAAATRMKQRLGSVECLVTKASGGSR